VDHDHRTSLLRRHPGWRLLRASNAAFVVSVLHRVFVVEKARTVGEPTLIEAVDDALYHQREINPEAMPRSAREAASRWVVGFEVILGAYSPLSMTAMTAMTAVSPLS